ncbi:hypothetical protein [Candidatus Nitrosocosmicus sp. SS]|jgi:hypothetical protein|uniref:hypothetical protein n=1 Tax=Candidatus Nitrosocosmicus agrestis TaxID=2563600 RepID=UPI00122E4EA7|nr:hypothetical protein [Candidatus Nitrosocosmicus sp. SS]KAA2279395.1 hypothetical protein F1Z66_13480 [Candidatus Nitrosocosmicus sp. SS]KAF0868083.1 hypothetical protein E5N71_12020 [Candidatus Nitrosocosmicus sp. SS]
MIISKNVIYSLTIPVAVGILLMTISSTNTGIQSAEAQNVTNTTSSNATSSNSTSAIDTFRAQGQISSLASDTLAGRTSNSSENAIWVLGGDWEFNVANGNLTNFVADIDMTQVDGTAAHKHSIEKINNATGMPMGAQEPLKLNFMTGEPNSKIALVNGNSTMFRGTADITTNGEVKWKDVLIHVTMQNGNILNINIDPAKTEDHFKGLPVFGTVQSIIDENGKELLKK